MVELPAAAADVAVNVIAWLLPAPMLNGEAGDTLTSAGSPLTATLTVPENPFRIFTVRVNGDEVVPGDIEIEFTDGDKLKSGLGPLPPPPLLLHDTTGSISASSAKPPAICFHARVVRKENRRNEFAQARMNSFSLSFQLSTRLSRRDAANTTFDLSLGFKVALPVVLARIRIAFVPPTQHRLRPSFVV
jgi:hypothetical protein